MTYVICKFKSKENKKKSKVDDEKNNAPQPSPGTNKSKNLRRARQKREASGEQSVTPEGVLDAASDEPEKRSGPIWFSLVASEEQEGEVCLPQIQTNYLRIKDGSMSVSFVQKYIMKKLDLTSETDIVIKCMGQPVSPSLEMYNLVDLWLQTTSPTQRFSAPVGSSAKDLVMVLGYSRKISKS